MADNPLAKIALGKWITLAVVLVVVAFVLLTQFTSFQSPRSITEGAQEPEVHPGIQLGTPTTSRTNLDETYDIIHGETDTKKPTEATDAE